MLVKRALFFIILIVLSLSGCATVQRRTIVEKKNEIFLKDFCQHYGLSWEWDHVSQTIRFSDKNNEISLLLGSRVMFVGDKKIFLSAPVVLRESLVVLPRDFLQFIVIHVRVKIKDDTDYKILKVKKIIIDAGHGGHDPGAIGGDKTYEKDIVLAIARGLKNFLEKEGFEVQLTRGDDRFLSLKERSEISANIDADLFISIHANASLNKRVQGIEVFSLKDLSEEQKGEEQLLSHERTFLKRVTGKSPDQPLREIVSDMLYTYKQAESEALARNIVKESIQYTRAVNRGVKYAQFYVLRNTLIPAILIEVGFLSHKQEERSLKKASYQQKIIEGIGKGIVSYANN
ncbi:MAG TPA: N-acetylmuramoyl-L-alanine amidase [Candidatus Omnitrophota bacterium]|nr:N-acetylmuramoyl-L-alanine amidase [Candidatus Omnitrophota bacterium]